MNLALSKISYIILAVLAFVLPLLSIPAINLAIDLEKRLLFFLAMAAVVIIWLLGRLADRQLVFPRNWLLPAFFLVFLVSLVAGLTSVDPFRSLLAFGYERDTVFALFVLFLVLAAGAAFINSKERWLLLSLGVVFAGSLAVVYQIVQTIFVNLIGWSFLPGGSFNLVGKWNEAGFFWGLAVLLGLSLLEVLPWRSARILRYLVIISVALAILALVAVNSWQAWLILGLGGLALLVYKIWLAHLQGKKKIPWILLVVVIFSLGLSFLIRPNSQLNLAINTLSNKVGISTIEVNPSWLGTYLVAKEVIAEKPLFGFGPNSSVMAWNKFKPAGVNETPFWNSDFINLVGFVPTFVVTTGVLGVVAWIIFFVFFLYYGFLVFTHKAEDETLQAFTVVSFVSSFYLWLVLIVYPPDIVLLFLTLLITGTFVALLTKSGVTGEINISWASNSKYSFAGVLVAALLIMVVLGGTYVVAERFVAAVFFSRALAAGAAGDNAKAENLLTTAIKISPSEVFYRVMVDLKLRDLEGLLSQDKLDPEVAKTKFESIVRDAVYSGQEAIKQSSSNYANWLSLGLVYESLVPLNIEGAYTEAAKAYEKASSLNPTNPAIFINRARLEVAAKDRTKAREYVNQAINLKRNYTEAIFVLAQLDTQSGNLREAIKRSEEAVAFSPFDPVAFFQLGFLKYQAGDARGAVEGLVKAIELNPNYANARYFLGLAYDSLGEKDKALNEFKIISQTNADNKEIAQIIENLQAGRRALENTPPPAPKDRKKLPVEDEE